MTVPARPVSITPPVSGPGVTSQSSPSSLIAAPRARKASAISSVSRARSGATIREGPSASAANTSTRLVRDLDPGRPMRATIGARARGAGQGCTPSVCPTPRSGSQLFVHLPA